MAVNFKFRSSLGFDSVGIDGPSISVYDLRAKIVDQKNLKVCEDFGLVISDAQTGKVFQNENHRIPAGADVIIKRVPAARANTADDVLCSTSANGPAFKCGVLASTPGSSPSSNVDTNNFDDFGMDLYTAPEKSFLGSDFDENKLQYMDNEETNSGTGRFFPEPALGCQNLEAEKEHGQKDGAVEKEIVVQTNLRLMPKDVKPNEIVVLKIADKSPSMLPNVDLPSELKCSLCKAIFKEAVMIPCCQHSFCEKCIRLALVEKARCPQCLSSRCKVDDLLPNVSLRQAIERFLESQVLICGLDNGSHKYPPDGESGIQVKEASCAVSIHKMDTQLAHSPSATGKGSNQVYAESVCESLVKEKGISAAQGPHIIHIEDDKCVSTDYQMDKGKETKNFVYGDDVLPAKLRHSFIPKEEDGSVNFACSSRNRKGERRCYACGSPDHLVKDCPMASVPMPLPQSGDPVFSGGMPAFAKSYYWHGTSFPHVRPFTSLYGGPGPMPFDPNMVPVSPFAVPPYMRHMYPGLPIPCGFLRMGGLASPLMAGAERPLSRKEFMELQEIEKRRKVMNEQLDRESYDDDDMVNATCLKRQRRPVDFRTVDRDSVRSYSGGSEHQQSKKKQKTYKHSGSVPCETSDFISDDEILHSKPRKDHQSSVSQRDRFSDKSCSEVQDRSGSSGFHSKGSDRLRHRHRSSKKYGERSECPEKNSLSPTPVYSGKSHHKARKDTSTHRRETDLERHSEKHHNHSKTDRHQSHHSSSADRSKHQHSRHLQSTSSSERGLTGHSRQDEPEKGDTIHCRRHSKNKVMTVPDEIEYDRWEMANSSDIDDGGVYHHNEYKRSH